MTTLLSLVVALLLLWLALWTVLARDAFLAVAGFVVYGLLLSLVWVRLAGIDCSAQYLHEPGDPKDGITVTVPIYALNQVAPVRAFDGNAHLLGKDSGLAAMVHVAVSDEDLLQRHSGLLQRLLEPVEIAAGIDQRALHRFRAPDQRAVLLESRDRHDADAHRKLGGFAHAGEMAAAARDCNFTIFRSSRRPCR